MSACASIAIVLVIAGLIYSNHREKEDLARFVADGGRVSASCRSNTPWGWLIPNLCRNSIETAAIDMAGSEIDDQWLWDRHWLRFVTHLSLGGCDITDYGVAALSRGLRLQFVDLSSTRTSDACFDNLSGLSHLREIDLSLTQITGAGVSKMRDASFLHTVRFTASQFDDSGAHELSSIESVRIVDVSATRITDIGVRDLLSMSLCELYVADSAITDGAVPSIEQCKSLRLIDVRGTQVTRDRVTALRNLVPHLEVRY
jgi:hypothetical protein